MLLELRRVTVSVAGRVVLKEINMEIGRREVHVLLGPNGAGKSTLLKAIMGLPDYDVVEGEMYFEDVNLLNLKPYERAKLGIALSHQNPPKLSIRTSYFFTKLIEKYGGNFKEFIDYCRKLNIEHLIDRELFRGFSGGEIKRVELLTVLSQRPKLALLDEPDSGVDIDSIVLVGSLINDLVDRGASILLVTHTGTILKYLRKIDVVHVLIGGKLIYSGDPGILPKLFALGYERFLNYISTC
ncbi:MAG: ABC transporter ATP-binding protein [Thermoprotei archaeon]|nr:MAG: ABC transporter ATP-binding protein [Thermoprotei archaeon]